MGRGDEQVSETPESDETIRDRLLEQKARTTALFAAKLAIGLMHDEELIEAVASFYMKLFEALTKEGFTPDYAMRIICTAKLPTLGS